MNAARRIRLIRIIEKIEKNPEFSNKLEWKIHLILCQINNKKWITHNWMSVRRRKKMLTVLFTICMIWFVGKFFIFGLKASWGIMKLLCMVIFFPVILIGMVVGGLMYIAFPLLIIGGIIGLVTSHS